MEELDADEVVLKDASGKEALRDIVQLVKYEDFKDLGMRELAFEVLGEVPDQFIDYQVLREQEPDKLYKLTEQDHIVVQALKQRRQASLSNKGFLLKTNPLPAEKSPLILIDDN